MQTEILLMDSERQPCEVWTRVMGYFRPVSHFNEGKKSEFKERICFIESKVSLHINSTKAVSKVA